MHPYTVKNWLWVAILLMIIFVSLAGCSSAPKQSKLASNQYCHTKQEIVTQNKDTVSSTTLVKCSDDPVDQYVPAKLGLAKDCYETYVPMYLGGRLVQEKIYVCQKLSGVYDVIDSATVR